MKPLTSSKIHSTERVTEKNTESDIQELMAANEETAPADMARNLMNIHDQFKINQ